jgi:predicted AlkP superfamily phosphohydrolase/phosphomutase
MGSRGKVIVIGLDGATFDFIRPMVRRGELPNIANLLQSGVSGMLASTYPPVTPTAWATFSTGKNPGKHGVFDFRSKPYSTDATVPFSNFNSIKCATFWEILRDTGLRFGIVNLPMTYLAQSLNGFLIAGMDTPNDRVTFSYPEDLVAELRSNGIPYQAKFLPPGQSRPKDLNQLLERFFQVEEEHKNAFLYLISKKTWDVFVGVFTLLDKVQHFFWHEHVRGRQPGDVTTGDPIYQAYRLIDRFVGEIVSVADQNTHVMLVSDHGYGKVEWIFFINEWLRREGLLTLKKREPFTFFQHVKFRGIKRTVSHVLGRLGLTGLGKILPSRILTMRLRLYVPEFRHSASTVDWSKTRAYGASWGIYINVKGRTSHGIVDPGPEYEQTRELIQERLQRLTDPSTGERLTLKALKKEEVYNGPYMHAAPDLVYDWKNFEVFPDHAYKFSNILSRRKHFGTHHSEGIFLLKGPGVKSNHRIDECQIADIAPTMFYLLRQPISNDFDGQVLKDAFLNDYRKRNPIRFQEQVEIALQRRDEDKTYTAKELDMIAEQLRNLGYL